MRTLISILFLLMAMSVVPGLSNSAAAQTPVPPAKQASAANIDRRAQGYVFFGPGATSGSSTTWVNFGGGGEGFVKGGLSVGGEVAGFTPASAFDNGFGILSANAGYHFLKASRSGKVVPFVSGGYSLFFRSSAASGVNFGGGVDYWFKDRVGLRFEIRDHVIVEYPDTHYAGFRVGLTFR